MDSQLEDVRLIVNLGLREISPSTIASFDEHIVDDLRSCANQSTPFAEALRSKLVVPQRVHQLSAFSRATFTTDSKRRIYFQPLGMVTIDLRVATRILELYNGSIKH